MTLMGSLRMMLMGSLRMKLKESLRMMMMMMENLRMRRGSLRLVSHFAQFV